MTKQAPNTMTPKQVLDLCIESTRQMIPDCTEAEIIQSATLMFWGMVCIEKPEVARQVFADFQAQQANA